MEYHLKTPLSAEDVKKLKLGDIVYLSGKIYTARDEAHMHILHEIKEGKKIPIELKGMAVYHCGPIVKKIKEGVWELVAAGPTTSSRMNSLEPEFIEKTGVRAIIGKGGMNKGVSDAMAKHGCVYLAFTGGAAILAAKGLNKVEGVYLEELGMPEAVWIMNAENFGPLVVGITAHGENMFVNLAEEIKKNEVEARKKLGI
ncbi:MAG: FumA C-terminus/TtdB family hydratase beta subunit [Thermoplasmata archaeon]|nr:FumA C-terminus/TtdB family hydratase beta subunit [Thermoplasmata archaeon]